MPSPRDHVAVWVGAPVYTTRDGLSIVQSYTETTTSDLADAVYIRHSSDNGETWSARQLFFKRASSDNVKCAPHYFLDPDNGLLLRFYMESPSLHDDRRDWAYNVSRRVRTWRNFIQISRDAGKTWGRPQQIVQKGEGYDSIHWAQGISVGRNSGYVNYIKKMDDDTLFAPFQMWPMINAFINGKRRDVVAWNLQIGVFLGRWRDDLSGIDWDMGEYVSVAPTQSTRGVCEPATAFLQDDRILMIMRACNDGQPGMPGVKFFTISRDGGRTWDKPRPLTFDDGSILYSPASYSMIFQSGKNGKTYWIANIVDNNPRGGYPRYPLQIAEIDTDSFTIWRDSVTIIDDLREGEPAERQYSNFSIYEDRLSKDLILFMTEFPLRSNEDWTAHSYRYEIEIPEA